MALALAVTAAVGLLTASPAAAASGDQEWVSRYHGPSGLFDDPHAVAMSPDGSRTFVTGESTGADTSTDFATVACDSATGAILWATRSGTRHDPAGGYALAVSPDGQRVFVTGYVYDRRFYSDYGTFAYDAATGAELWRRLYDGPTHLDDSAHSLAVSPDGTRVYVTGTTYDRGSYGDYATVAYDATTGDNVWIRTYDGGANNQDQVQSLAVSPDGTLVYVTGSSWERDSYYDYTTLAYDSATGATRWRTRYDGPAHLSDHPRGMAVSSDGTRVFVTGGSDTGRSSSDYATVAYDAHTGATQWTRRYDGVTAQGDFATALAVSPDGARVYVTGTSEEPPLGYVFTTIAYDEAIGAREWIARYDGPTAGGGTPVAVAASPDGAKVFVTGFDWGNTYPNDDYATQAYDAATGSTLWTSRYDGPAHSDDDPEALAVSPDGTRVVVTGTSPAKGFVFDYTTVAYEA